MIPPASLMAPIPPAERERRIQQSPLMAEYGKPVDRESAKEMLEARAKAPGAAPSAGKAAAGGGRAAEPAPNMAEAVGKAINSPLGRAVGRELVRGLFGVLGVSTGTRRRRSF
jgi:hypothetical protein